MSSLQKFHRRTNGGAPAIKLIGSESVPAGAGFYLGFAGDGTSYMYVAPKSTEAGLAWGSYGTARNTISTTNGLANTNTLAGFGQAAHPAAYHCKNLTTGGYNTWYLPAINELITCFSSKSVTPFATANSFIADNYWSSTENPGNPSKTAFTTNMTGNAAGTYVSNKGPLWGYTVRAVRRSII